MLQFDRGDLPVGPRLGVAASTTSMTDYFKQLHNKSGRHPEVFPALFLNKVLSITWVSHRRMAYPHSAYR